MNFADLEKTWRSPLNRPDPAALDLMKQSFLAEHDRRRLGHKRFLFFVVVALTFITLRFLNAASWLGGEGGTTVDLAREWGAVIFLLIPWAGVVMIARRLARHDREHGSAGNIGESIRALVAENRVNRMRLRVAAALHLSALLILPVVVYQLRAVGKAGDEILVPAFVIWPLIAGAILLGLWWHDRRKLAPRQRELEALLKDYE
jgi:hypothetical protein